MSEERDMELLGDPDAMYSEIRRLRADVDRLTLRESELLLKLIDADHLAKAVDVAVERGMNPRNIIADARLNYGEPREYEWSDNPIPEPEDSDATQP